MKKRTKNKCLVLILFILSTGTLSAQVSPRAKTLYMSDTDVARIQVILGRSAILSFPTKPSKVVLGNKNHFAVEYIENDIALSALHPNARCNLVIYLQGRRFSFDLVTVMNGTDEIIVVRDPPLRKKGFKKWNSKRR